MDPGRLRTSHTEVDLGLRDSVNAIISLQYINMCNFLP
jgi:hypothetical protein